MFSPGTQPPALTTFPSERSVLVKERASGCYRLSAYFCAKSLSDVPLYTMMPTVYALVTFHCLGLHHGYEDVAASVSNLLYNKMTRIRR